MENGPNTSSLLTATPIIIIIVITVRLRSPAFPGCIQIWFYPKDGLIEFVGAILN